MAQVPPGPPHRPQCFVPSSFRSVPLQPRRALPAWSVCPSVPVAPRAGRSPPGSGLPFGLPASWTDTHGADVHVSGEGTRTSPSSAGPAFLGRPPGSQAGRQVRRQRAGARGRWETGRCQSSHPGETGRRGAGHCSKVTAAVTNGGGQGGRLA